MLTEVRMRKEDQLSFGTDTMVPTKDGKLSMKKMLQRSRMKDL
jgi:hypothetical protein